MAVAAGQDVTLQCQADGYPKPTITWKKAVGKLNLMSGNKNLLCNLQTETSLPYNLNKILIDLMFYAFV